MPPETMTPKVETPSLESVTNQVCKNQIEAYETYKTSFRKRRNLPEILAILEELKSECEKFAKQLVEQKLLHSPITCFPSYPWELKDLKTIDNLQSHCFDSDKFTERVNTINTQVEKVSEARSRNEGLSRFMLSLSLCIKQREWKQLLIQKSAFKKAIHRYPLMYSRNSASFLSLENTIDEQRYSREQVKRAIAQNKISPISCKHPEMKRLMQCGKGEQFTHKSHEASPCFLWWIASDEY